MNVIPFLKKPTAQEILKYTSIPCYADAKRIILTEIEKNNEILLVGDAASHLSETYVIIDFANPPQIQYDDMKSRSYRDDGLIDYTHAEAFRDKAYELGIKCELYEVTDKRNTHTAYSAGMFLEIRKSNMALDKLFSWIEEI